VLVAILAFHLRAPARGPAWLSRISAATLAERPNILLVIYDARRRDDFSFGPFGNRRADTPFLDAFKDQAAFFEDAVAPGAWTIPVHASMFSGLSVCELGIGHYNPGFAAFPTSFLSLAEILSLTGYRTIAYADHPFFHARNRDVSLLRGFEQASVIVDFERYGELTNVATGGGTLERRFPFEGLTPLSVEDVRREIDRFNAGLLTVDPSRDGDRDPERGLWLARLPELFRQSDYFRRRYREDFERHVFASGESEPYFLFLNLHMTMIAMPDPALYARWYLRSLMLNAAARGRRLTVPRDETVTECLERNFRELGLHRGLPRRGLTFMKHTFDTRFYDASFEAVWRYLEQRGLTRNLLTIVASDHGMSLGEHDEALYLHEGAVPHEYITRVPLVVRFPEGSPLMRHHGVHRERVSLTDVFKTIVDAAVGEDVFERELPIRGRSLAGRLLRSDFERVIVSESAIIPGPHEEWPDIGAYTKAVYVDRFKLIYAKRAYRLAGLWPNHVRLGDTASVPALVRPTFEPLGRPLALLFDIAADPEETVNLAGQKGAEVERLVRYLSGQWRCVPYSVAAERPQWEEEARDTLRALGYLQ
jgi:arylsulfatase A-like enzyme